MIALVNIHNEPQIGFDVIFAETGYKYTFSIGKDNVVLTVSRFDTDHKVFHSGQAAVNLAEQLVVAVRSQANIPYLAQAFDIIEQANVS